MWYTGEKGVLAHGKPQVGLLGEFYVPKRLILISLQLGKVVALSTTLIFPGGKSSLRVAASGSKCSGNGAEGMDSARAPVSGTGGRLRLGGTARVAF